jgi:hypothetical protein
MDLKKFWLKDLQPTDSLRKEQQQFFSLLTLEELEKITPFPQVTTINGLDLILDGNNRSANYALRNIEQIRVEYVCPGRFETILASFNGLYNQAIQFQEQGIFNPYDLSKTISNNFFQS